MTGSAINSDDYPEQEFQPHWVSRAAFPLVTAILISAEASLFYAVYRGWLWLVVPLILVVSHLMHGQLIGFHEASHGMLRKNRRLNELDGVFIGILSFTSFSLYRAAHQTHHAHLGAVRDEELWPFVDPKIARWKRVTFALLELFAGLIFTPLIFLRTFLRKNSPIRNKRVRRRIWLEFLLIGSVWAGVLMAVTIFHVWPYFLALYFIPAFLAANLQSWRKYIEHVGLTGSTVRSATRSIVADGWLGKFVAFTLLHEPYHGVHHLRAGLGHAELAHHVSVLTPDHPEELAPFPTYRHAFFHLLRCLADPRVGAQWRTASPAGSAPTATHA
jgi:fatty acid desaturase